MNNLSIQFTTNETFSYVHGWQTIKLFLHIVLERVSSFGRTYSIDDFAIVYPIVDDTGNVTGSQLAHQRNIRCHGNIAQLPAMLQSEVKE